MYPPVLKSPRVCRARQIRASSKTNRPAASVGPVPCPRLLKQTCPPGFDRYKRAAFRRAAFHRKPPAGLLSTLYDGENWAFRFKDSFQEGELSPIDGRLCLRRGRGMRGRPVGSAWACGGGTLKVGDGVTCLCAQLPLIVPADRAYVEDFLSPLGYHPRQTYPVYRRKRRYI